MQNFYEILKVSHDAQERTIAIAYNELYNRFFPSRENRNTSNEKFILIYTAYFILINDHFRMEFDKILSDELYIPSEQYTMGIKVAEIKAQEFINAAHDPNRYSLKEIRELQHIFNLAGIPYWRFFILLLGVMFTFTPPIFGEKYKVQSTIVGATLILLGLILVFRKLRKFF